MKHQRQPTLYLTHGAGPCFWTDLPEPFGPHAFDKLRSYFTGLIASLPEKPRAVLVVSAHWETQIPTIGMNPTPPMIYDYSGFPANTYQLDYPAPAALDIAVRAQELLTAANIASAIDDKRGYDHGVFVPMMVIDPSAEIPVALLSLRHDLDAAQHLAIGHALAPLRDDGVLIVGSGSSYHNLREFRGDNNAASFVFDQWLNETMLQTDTNARDRSLINWAQAPAARVCHPREEHLLPLMVAAGAANADTATRDFNDTIAGKAMSCFRFG